MRQTRRQFVGTVAALGALAASGAKAATPPSPPRIALDDFVRDPKKLASLRRGVAAMKARDPSDHRSWFFQGAVHAYSDALYQDALSRDPKLANVDAHRFWNRCPHFGQASADFVIWHRAYLHYFERILRDAAQDPDLSLPYWNYALTADRSFPEAFAAKMADGAPNPLYHPNRELAFVLGDLQLSSAIGDARAANDALNFFHEPGVPGLAGDHLGPDETQIGLLEQRPHNDVHLAVGGVVGTANGAMAEITTAAFDPVFWVHHANIDRMWAAWLRAPNKRWGTMPPDDWWNETPWEFHDADGSVARMSRADTFALEANYDGMSGSPLLHLPQKETAFLSGGAAPPPTGDRHHGNRAAPPPVMAAPPPPPPPPPPKQRQLIADAGSFSVSPRAPSKQSVATAMLTPPRVGAKQGGGAGSLSNNVPLPQPQTIAPDATVYLELTDIHFDRVPSSGFAVYLDRTNTKGVVPVGLIDLFGATHHTMPGMAMGATQRFDVTRFIKSGIGAFTVRIEPYDLLVTKTGATATQRRDAVHIGAVKFVVVS